MNKKHFDQHIHSVFSFDSETDNTLENIVKSSIDKGLSGIAVTDHLDPLWPDEDDPAILDISAYQAALTATEQSFSERIQFSKGIELGLLPGEALDICSEIVGKYPYDFVIGSMHYSLETPIDYPAFLEDRSTKDIIDEYYTLLLESIRIYKDYDVLGHINAIDRYTPELAPESLYMPYIDEILKVSISDGKGIEINTSSYGRYNRIVERGTPSLQILTHYKELGGEIVTIGSDAHKNTDIGAFLEEGEKILQKAGFKYQSFYKNRTPEFFAI